MQLNLRDLNCIVVGTDPLSQQLMDMFLREHDPIKPWDEVILTLSFDHENKEEQENYWIVDIEREAYSPGPYPGTCEPYHEHHHITMIPETIISKLCGTLAIVFSKRYKTPIRAQLVLEFGKVNKR